MAKKAGGMSKGEIQARKRRFEDIRQKTSDEETKRISDETKNQSSNAWLYFAIVCGEAWFNLPSGYIFDSTSLFKQITHYVDSVCEEYLMEKWPFLNIGALKVLLFLMQQSDEKPNTQAICGFVKSVNDYLEKCGDAHLEDYLVALPEKTTKWEDNKTLEIFEQMIVRLEKRLAIQSKDFFDIENISMKIEQKIQQSKSSEDEEPARKRPRSSSML